MNHRADPPTSPSWHQVLIQFDDYSTAEHTAVTHLGPQLTSAETAGLITSWFFIRKAPCWRLRFLPSHHSTELDPTTLIHQRLDTLRDTGRIASWIETIYEPETPPDRLRAMESGLRQLMTVDTSPTSTSPLMKDNGSLTFLSDWAAAFTEAGRALGDLARDGTLRRGVRAVLAHHVIFHWNRIGLPYTTQSILANVATAVILGQ